MKLLVALIHNRDAERNRTLRRSLLDLKNFIPNNLSVHFMSIYRQENLEKLPLLLRIRKFKSNAAAFLEIQRAIAKARRGPWGNSTVLMRLVIFLIQTFGLSLLKHLRPAREIELTKKHVQAWEALIQSDCDALLVLEDDANCILDGVEFSKISEDLISILQKSCAAGSPVVMSLAKGFGLEAIGAGGAMVSNLDGIIHIDLPIIDTAAAYLLSRPAARRIILEYPRMLDAELINADFLFNSLALNSLAKCVEPPVISIHLVKPIFDNASIHGRYSSSI